MTRYARSQFIDPNLNHADDDSDKPFYAEEDESASEDESESSKKRAYTLDPDHRLLLRSARPLLQSRNASVVMSVAQLYHHVSPKSDVPIIAKSLIRLLRSYREVQSVVLNSIASISIVRKKIFEPYLKSFFVRTSDPTHIKILKLDILTNLATETNISIILREFQTYISSVDKQFVAATVHAIGRCACDIKEIRESCLNGLVTMLSNRDEAVVAESVVVIKKLLQTHPNAYTDIIKHMARLADSITVPQARASILWLLGEYSHLVPKLAPDVLRKMAKIFINEEEIVKLQILNLAVKLFLTNPEQTKLLCQYVLTLARYDQNYDIRDRSRLLRQILFPQNENSKISQRAREIFLANKPAPLLLSNFIDREEFQMGSLSHYINTRAHGYHDLPLFPETPPDPSVRNVPTDSSPKMVKKQIIAGKKKSFYSDTDNSSPEESNSEDSDEKSSEDESNESESEGNENLQKSEQMKKGPMTKKVQKNESTDDEEDSDDDSDSSEEESDEDSEEGSRALKSTPKLSNIDLLLELDNFEPAPGVMPPESFFSPLIPLTTNSNVTSSSLQFVGPMYVPDQKLELLNKINASGQLSILGKFTRSPHIYSSSMASIELTFYNHHSETLNNIRMGSKTHGTNIVIHEFSAIPNLMAKESRNLILGVNFNDSTQPISFEILWNCQKVSNKANVPLKVSIGELLRPVAMPEAMFLEEQGKLKGMNEHSLTIPVNYKDKSEISQYVYNVANFTSTQSSDLSVLRYSAQTLSSHSLVLLTITLKDPPDVAIVVNCEKMVVGSMILNEVKNSLSK